jgi:tripartite ATP-independent transporter DctM subunit
MLANVSVGALFLAGILPGLLLAVLMMATVSYFAWRNKWGGDTRFQGALFGKAMLELAVVAGWPLAIWLLVAKLGLPPRSTVVLGLVVLFVADRVFRFQAVLPIMTPVLLVGGMTTGLFTPTEGAIAACIWAMVLGFFWYRTLNLKSFTRVCLDTVETTATVLFIVAASSIFAWMLTATGVTAAITQWFLGVTREPWLFLLLINLLMLFVGCFLEPVAAITILVPILVPVAQQLGIDTVHLGLVMVLNLMIGLLTPPVGLVLFIMARITGMSVERTTVALMPWFIPLLASLAIITYFPALFLWLPRMFY